MNGFVENVWVGGEAALPEFVAENDDGVLSRFILPFPEEAAEMRLDANGIEKIGAG